MADIRPFRGLRYNPAYVRALGDALSPPFDVLSPEDQAALYAKNPYNVVRLELARDPEPGAGGDRYTAAGELLRRWQRDGVLLREQLPAFYTVRRHFPYRGRALARTEVIAAVRLAPFGTGAVKPHEDTRAGPKQDRLRLMEATRANISPIMLLYQDPGIVKAILEESMNSFKPVEAMVEGERLQLWPVLNRAAIDSVREELALEPLYIADGHHRFETALAYRDRVLPEGQREGSAHACAFVMAGLVAFDDPGLLSLPYHRVLQGLDAAALGRVRERAEAVCAIERHATTGTSPAQVADAALESLERRGALFEVWGMEPGVRWTLRLRDPLFPKSIAGARSLAWASLSTTVFREAVLRPALGIEEEEAERRGWLAFAKDATEAIAMVQSGRGQVAFLPHAVPMATLKEVSDRRERLPPKSTYFHPKLATGLVLNPLEGEL